ncbi:MAG TPA: hypothetical protein C5S37_00940 [Methanophagales archaeon]|nr:hypothetical protein [Methanophagales archaeon]
MEESGHSNSYVGMGMIKSEIDKNPFHAVCAPHEDALIIITVYRPDLNIWMPNYKTRRGK